MKKVFVAGSSGFIGGHLVKRLKDDGYFVVGADIVEPEYEKPHVFYKYDLRNNLLCRKIFQEHGIADVYNLACIMGGMGFIGDPKHSYDIMVGSTLIVSNVLDCAITYGADRIFYSSSACVYNESHQLHENSKGLAEWMAYPAAPDLVYGWQKLFSEQMHTAAKDKIKVRIARFHNIYGPQGTWKGGKEKAPAAMCRKVSEAETEVEIWGDGKQTRSFLYIDDCIDAVRLLMESDYSEPINIGSEEMVSINDLAYNVMLIANKRDLTLRHDLTKPQGVRGRNSDNTLIREVLGWEPKFTLYKGLEQTYQWINEQVKQTLSC